MPEFTTLDGELQVRRAIDALDQGRDKMQENNRDDRRKAVSGTRDTTTKAVPRAGTAEQRRKMRQGLRLLARMIARAHLRRQHPVPQRSGHRIRGLAVEPLPEPAVPPTSTTPGIPSAPDVTHRHVHDLLRRFFHAWAG